MILSNQVQCLNCGDTPYSAHVHDFVSCSCGGISVDGGMEYLRRVGDLDSCIDMSITVTTEHLEGLKKAITDTSKNSLGKVCNLVRYLRDEMGIHIQEDE